MRCLAGYLWLLMGSWIFAGTADHLAEYLKPIPVTGWRALDSARVDSLEGSDGSPLWMIARPSLLVGYGVFVHQDVRHHLAHRGPAVRHYLPDPQNPFEMTEKAPVVSTGWFLERVGDLSCDRHRVRIDELLVKNLLGAWEAVLKQTRYSDPRPVVDGTTYYFQCSREAWGEEYAGQTHSPSSGPARDLVKLGELLAMIPLKEDVASRIALIELARAEASRIHEMGER